MSLQVVIEMIELKKRGEILSKNEMIFFSLKEMSLTKLKGDNETKIWLKH